MAIDPNNLASTAKLTFSDDFNSLSLRNGTTGTWNTTYHFDKDYSTLSGNGEVEWYINANDPNTANVDPWTTSNGILTISAAPADPAIKPYINNYNYTSGLLTTQNSFSQTYGYFEISAKLPAGQGLWPAFWLLPTTPGAWRPEVDVFEVLGSDTTSLWQFSHPADTTYDRYFNTPVADMSAGFHRYGVDWEPDKLTFYFDGKVTGVAPTAPEMNGPMYLLVNLALGGSWAGPPDATTKFPANMQIDYIRAYQPLGAPTVTNLALSPGSISAAEGSSGSTAFVYTVTRTGDLSAASTAAWSVQGSGVNAATASDFAGGLLPGGTVSFAANQSSATITVNVAGDTTNEPDEGFTVSLSNATGATITTASATGTILNDDAPPTAPSATSLAISPATITQAEGNSGTTYYVYTVTRSGDLSGPSVASFSVAGSGSNPASASDFNGGTLPSGQVFFGGGEATKSIWIAVNGDTTPEATETFAVTLSNPSGAAISTGTAQGVITNDDGAGTPAAPSLALGPASVSHAEGASGSTAFAYTVTRSGDLSAASTASWAVTGSGANAANAADFTGGILPTGNVSFAAGQSSASITVNVAGDTVVEPDEGFTLTLSNPTGASIATATAQGLITNDDGAVTPAAPSLALGPGLVSQAEGASGSTAFAYTVTRSGDLSAASTAAWAVAGSGANAANAADFTGGILPTGNVSFAAGQSSASITVNVAGDTVVEPDEGFTLTLSNPTGASIATATAQGLITNDDAAAPAPAGAGPSLSLSPQSASQPEGTGGESYFVFNVVRSGDVSGPTVVDWAVSGTGSHPASTTDFSGSLFPSGRVYFGGGEGSKSIWVPIVGDSTAEADEQFVVTLSNPSGAIIVTGTATGLIQNDDGVFLG